VVISHPKPPNITRTLKEGSRFSYPETLQRWKYAQRSILKNMERYEFCSIRPNEADQAATIEQICFPPNEACSEQHMKARIAKAPELFLVAVDKSTGRLAGFLNGLATDENAFRDEFFTDADLYNPAGKNIMLLGLDVLPEDGLYRQRDFGFDMGRRRVA
jgi:hypothetical protein